MTCAPAWASCPVTGRSPPIARWGSAATWRPASCCTPVFPRRTWEGGTRPTDSICLLSIDRLVGSADEVLVAGGRVDPETLSAAGFAFGRLQLFKPKLGVVCLCLCHLHARLFERHLGFAF